MDKTKIVEAFTDVALFAAVGLLWYNIGRETGEKRASEGIIVQRDTMIVRDTIKVSEPVFLTEYEVRKEYIPLTDTIRQHDTTFVVLPRTIREYRDSSYFAKVSGINPALDYIEVYSDTKYIASVQTEKVYPKPSFVSIRADAMYDKSLMLPVTLNFGHRWKGFEVTGGGGYDFLTRSPVIRVSAELKIGY